MNKNSYSSLGVIRNFQLFWNLSVPYLTATNDHTQDGPTCTYAVTLTFAYTIMHVCTHKYVCSCTHTCAHKLVHAYALTHIHLCTHTYTHSAHAHTHTHLCMDTHTLAYGHTHTRAHTPAHAHTPVVPVVKSRLTPRPCWGAAAGTSPSPHRQQQHVCCCLWGEGERDCQKKINLWQSDYNWVHLGVNAVSKGSREHFGGMCQASS